MTRTVWLAALIIGLSACLPESASAEVHHRFGAGVHYWRTVDSVELSDIDEDGLAPVFSYQCRPSSILQFEVAVEVLPKDFAGAIERIYSPQVSVLVGSAIYGGVGVGTYYLDGEFSDDIFYMARAGLIFEPLPSLYLDINLNYRFDEWGGLSEIAENAHSDTMTLGAAIRLEI